MKKSTFYTELAYVAGILVLAFGTSLMAKADFGLSMIVAPAYILHLKVSEVLPFFSFGMAEYCLQAVILLLLCIVMKKAKWNYLFSFGTAVFYGITLDMWTALVKYWPMVGYGERVSYFVIGALLSSTGVALFFRTYISPEAYELFVKELTAKLGADIGKVKTAYDLVSCAIAIVMSFLFFGFGHFEGVKAATILVAIVNGTLIARIGKVMDEKFEFTDGLKLRKYFEM